MKKRILIALIFVFVFSNIYALTCRIFDHPSYTRLVFEDSTPFTYHVSDEGGSVKIVLQTTERFLRNPKNLKSKRLKFISLKRENQYIEITLKKLSTLSVKSFVLESPFRIVFDFSVEQQKKKTKKVKTNPVKLLKTEASPQQEINSGGNSSSEGKEIRVIVIDPGHGGSELGAKGPTGVYEKDITLAIAKKLKEYIESNLGVKVYLTRDRDINLSLEERASIANNHKADMFISIHCNGSRSRKARGSETYILSIKATDKEARRLAFFENNFKEMKEDVGDNGALSDIKLILWDMAQTEFLKESARLAEYIQKELNILLGTKDRGIKQAPFRVLMNVAMPAVLVETAFISNRKEEKMLNDPEKQKKIAYAIYLGIKKYIINN